MYKIKNRVEVAKVGTWNDFNITEDILKEALKYSDVKIPIRPGHIPIVAGAKSHGFLENPQVLNGSLFYDQTLLDDTAKDWEQDRYINRSIDLSKRNGKYTVSAMALLGVEAPGIKGLRTFTENNKTIIRFTQKIKKEVTMPELKTFSDGFEEGRKAESNSLTLKFAEDVKKQKEIETVKLADNEAKLLLKIKSLEATIKELQAKGKETEAKRFTDKITEVASKFTETKQEEVKKGLKEFADSGMTFDIFQKVADLTVPQGVEFSDDKDFSKTETKKQINTANKI